jgi:benzoyl-CoA 2,3-dioxygenase component B
MSSVDYQEQIPNNVNLSDNRRLQRALESWQPAFLDWWKDMGPHGFQDKDVYLRTAINVGAEGWANFDYIKMPDYRWGIFLAEPEPDRTIGFGENLGQPVWQEVPGEHRADLRRLIVVQGDTEPASVEQQRQLGKTCPSIYDLRNLFQINVEEGRHLWAMVYLLHAYFGRDGREEAEGLLERRSGDEDKPRILGAFNEPTPDWLSFFMFTYFTDRDGRFQLSALAESGFDPLARTTQFMLKEEAHHMFVGTAGLNRVVQRTCDLMKEHDSDDLSDAGGIGLAMLQRYLNFHYSVSLDLFGGETSTNVANYYTAGLKGRFQEANRQDDHKLESTTHPVAEVKDGKIGETEVKELLALNEVLRDDYVTDCQKGLLAPPPPPGFPPPGGRLRPPHRLPRRPAPRPGRLGREGGRVAPHRRRPGVRHVSDAGRPGTRENGQLDRPAAHRDPGQADRLRVREALSLLEESAPGAVNSYAGHVRRPGGVGQLPAGQSPLHRERHQVDAAGSVTKSISCSTARTKGVSRSLHVLTVPRMRRHMAPGSPAPRAAHTPSFQGTPRGTDGQAGMPSTAGRTASHTST